MKKILFNDKYGLTEAVLDGRKTQTRMLVSAKLLNEYGHNKFSDKSYELIRHSPFKVGEAVAVAQSYHTLNKLGYLAPEWLDHYCEGSAGYDNKMFVQAALMPHSIEITNIRVERLQDISEEDCLKEGVYYHTEPPKHHEYDRYSPWSPSVKPYKFESEKYFCSAKYAFKHLIEKVSGKGAWERNPWVFVYDFKLVER